MLNIILLRQNTFDPTFNKTQTNVKVFFDKNTKAKKLTNLFYRHNVQNHPPGHAIYLLFYILHFKYFTSAKTNKITVFTDYPYLYKKNHLWLGLRNGMFGFLFSS